MYYAVRRHNAFEGIIDNTFDWFLFFFKFRKTWNFIFFLFFFFVFLLECKVRFVPTAVRGQHAVGVCWGGAGCCCDCHRGGLQPGQAALAVRELFCILAMTS